MRAVSTLALFFVVLAACGAPEQEAPPQEGPTLADFAGTWENVVTLEGVADPVASRLVGSPDGTTWHMILEGRDPISLQASLQGDSLISESEPYESILRPGVTTVVRTAAAPEGDVMVGTVRVTYRLESGEEQVVQGTMRGTRQR
jgi:hypothetical protein